MKIAVINPPFWRSPPTAYGGSEVVTWNLASGLTELGHKVVVFGANGSRVPMNGFVVEYGEELGEKGMQTDWREAEGAVHEKVKHLLDEFDIVHGHTWFGWEYMLKQDKADKRVCHTHHGHLNWNAKTKPSFVTNMIAISKYMQWENEQLGWKSAYVYNGIDTSLYSYNVAKGDRLLFIGRFDAFKRPHVALEVAKKLDMPIDLIGGSKFIQDPKYFDDLVAAVNKYPKARILADLPTEAKIPYIQNAKAVIVPSAMREPFGLVAVEAMSCGTPVVVSNDGALSELVTPSTGFVGKIPTILPNFVPAPDSEEVDILAAGVKVIEGINPVDCRNHVVNNFSRQAMARNYADLYKRMMEGEVW